MKPCPLKPAPVLPRSPVRRFITDTRGAIGTLSAFFLLLALIVTGLALDYANGLRTRAQLQTMADAAALSGALRLPDGEAATTEALAIAEVNGSNLSLGRMLSAGDVVTGRWNPATRTLNTSAPRPDAISVTTRRSAASGNPLRTLFLRLLGRESLDISVSAVGFRIVRMPCSGGGFFSARRSVIGNGNLFDPSFCLHGDEGVTMNNTNTFEFGSVISMPDLDDLIERGSNYGVDEALRVQGYRFTLPDLVPVTIEAMREGELAGDALPPFLTSGPVTLSHIDRNTSLAPNTLYVVNGPVDLGSNQTLREVGIVASGNIRAGSNLWLDRVVLATEGDIRFNTNSLLGHLADDFCATGVYSNYLLAMGNVEFNTQNEFRDMLIGARGEIDLGNNNLAVDGVRAEALGQISLGNSNSARSCEDGLGVELGTLESVDHHRSYLVY
ncbi:MAG: hypothetical protein JJT95_01335 [Pararhodobacter sp.]|nr:hypothetical protein [Pararhodobacter sp.]